MYALIFINEGNYNSAPYSSVIAVSENRDKLREKLREKLRDCVIEDIENNDEWSVVKQYDDIAELEHVDLDLYARYTIIETEVI